jgi:hypothetical protein
MLHHACMNQVISNTKWEKRIKSIIDKIKNYVQWKI